ncbi:MAG TPA: RNA methyltransferase, partial [Rhodospirillales bacterium]|nr:RNA methyltransferase [Rhodospirillales bacterium]
LAAPFARTCKKLDIRLTHCDSGIDCDIRGCGRNISLDARLDLSDVATKHDLARITVHGDIVLERRQPVLKIGPAMVVLPAGGFVQATVKGEDTLARLVLDAMGQASHVIDLFCGFGPFALRLAPVASVHAIDGDRVAIVALDNAVRHTQGLKPLTTEVRDLVRNPLHVTDLAPYDALVFDPPRTGAEAQARQIAASNIPLVVALSCDAATFTRDAAVLVDGGYSLEKVTPVDQFRYSAHVELVAVFRRL